VGSLGLVWLAGVILATPVVGWWLHDTRGISHGDWFWSGHDRRRWQYGVWLGWIAGGWVAIVIVSAWSRSDERADVLAQSEARARRRELTT
jgi:hypothetical protein